MNRRTFLTALGLAPAVAKAVPAKEPLPVLDPVELCRLIEPARRKKQALDLQQTAFEVRVPIESASQRRLDQSLQQLAFISNHLGYNRISPDYEPLQLDDEGEE